MHEVVAHDGQDDRHQRRHDHSYLGVDSEEELCRATHQNDGEHAHPEVGEQGDDVDEHRSDVAVLGARLDHLRQAQLRTLSGVESREERSERGSDDDRNNRPEQVEACEEPEGSHCEARQIRR